MNLKRCPKCQYVAKTNIDPLITKYNGLGECPNCGIIVQKYLDAQKKRTEEQYKKKFTKEDKGKKEETKPKKEWERPENTKNKDESISSLTEITDLYEYIENIISHGNIFGFNYNKVLIIFISFLGLLISGSFSGIFWGAIIGFIISKFISKNNNNEEFVEPLQVANLSFIPILIKFTNIDGNVSENEYKFIELYITNNFNDVQSVILLTNINKIIIDNYSITEYAMLLQEILNRYDIATEERERMYFLLFKILVKDTLQSKKKEKALQELPVFFELPKSIFSYCLGNLGLNNETKTRESIERYYKILGCSPNCTLSELKIAYREKSKEYHPDVLVSKNLPDELVKFSEEKFRFIKEAYEILKSKHER